VGKKFPTLFYLLSIIEMVAANFEWDEDKAKTNLRKHDISFNEAKTVFEDAYSLTLDDPTHSILEDCFLTIGYYSQNRLLLVVHTERQGNIRIISARRVTKHERKIYEQSNE
jgi:uncharacterized DUF497 family protein